MRYKVDKINSLFKGASPRKISIVSRLSGLTKEEIEIMKDKWLDGKSDVQICDKMGYSPATLTRKRRTAHDKILDSLDLYGLTDMKDLPTEEIFSYTGNFYKAQDLLVRFFMRNNSDDRKQKQLIAYLNRLTDK